MSLRNDLIDSAVTFLQDGSVADSPLAKKIEFLKAKGLTEDEVKEAIRRSSETSTPAISPPPPPVKDYSSNHPLYYSRPRPLSDERDWKDYLIMGAATAGLLYGAYKVVSNYVIPKVLPPSQTELEREKASVDQEFQRIQSLLDKYDEEQKQFYKQQEEKSQQIDKLMSEINLIITKTNEKNLQNEETLKYLKLQVDTIKTTLMKSLDSQKQTISSELGGLETQVAELRSQLGAISQSPRGADFFKSSSSIPSIADATTSPVKEEKTTSTEKGEAGAAPAKTVTPSKAPYSNLAIPPPSTIPSVDDILGSRGNAEIPSWQRAALEDDKKDSTEATIPSWQMNP